MSDDEFDELPTTRPATQAEYDELPTTRLVTQAEYDELTATVRGLFEGLGAVPASSRDDLLEIASALREGRLSIADPQRARAVGIALGMVLAYELALEWVHVEASELGRAEVALQLPSGRSDIFEGATWFPLSMVEKRVAEHVEVDVLDLYDRAVRWAADVEAADAELVASWGPFGDEVLAVLSRVEPTEAVVQAGVEAMQVVLERLVEHAGGHAFVLDRTQSALALAPLARIDTSSREPNVPPVPNPIGQYVAAIDDRVLFLAVLEREGRHLDARLASAAIRRILFRMDARLGANMPFGRCTRDELEALFAPLRG